MNFGGAEFVMIPCSPEGFPEAESSRLYFSLASIVSRISASTSERGREY